MQLSIQVKQAIFRLQKQNKSIKKLPGTFGVAKSTVSEVYRDILSAQNQPNVAKVIGRFIVQMDNNPKQQNQTQVF